MLKSSVKLECDNEHSYEIIFKNFEILPNTVTNIKAQKRISLKLNEINLK
jgi:hypothetical protein